MKYYYIKFLNLVTKGEGMLNNYIYKDGKWVEDTKDLVSDRLIGYDPTEPAGFSQSAGPISEPTPITGNPATPSEPEKPSDSNEFSEFNDSDKQ